MTLFSRRVTCFWFWLVLLCLASSFVYGLEALDPATAVPDADGPWLWYDATHLDIEGKGWADTAEPYHRLPDTAQGVVRDAVWNLSLDSAGLCVRFVSDADAIAARWTLTSKNLAMNHMPATGVSGLDLYVNDAGVWRWIGVGRPDKVENQATLASDIPPGEHEYCLYLPLYNGTQSLEIGIPSKAHLAKAAPRPAQQAKPVVFYGTSIVQGGCASRPGMAHPAIAGRMLDRPVINLGFSGNGKLDLEVGDLLAELDAAVYVLDCVPNMNPEMVSERAVPFVTALRAAKPDTPILLVENIQYQAGAFLPARRKAYEDKNAALRKAYDELDAQGIKKLYYLPCDRLLGDDGEATVDGTHCTDLGFLRFAEVLEPVLRNILKGLKKERVR